MTPSGGVPPGLRRGLSSLALPPIPEPEASALFTALGWASTGSGDAASLGESAQFRAGPAGDELAADQVADGGPGVDVMGGFVLGGEQCLDAVLAPAPLGVCARGVGPVPGPALGGGQAHRRNLGCGGDRRSRVTGVVFRGDAVQADGGRGEPAAVVPQQDSAAEAGGERRCLGGELAHAVPVADAGSGVGGGLDEQPAFGCQAAISAAQPGAGGGGERDGRGLGVPACLAGQDGQVPGRLGGHQRVAAAGGDDLGPVGGHPAELLVIELDQHPRGQRVGPGQQGAGLGGVAVRGEQVAGGDQPGEPVGQPAVPAVVKVGQRGGQP